MSYLVVLILWLSLMGLKDLLLTGKRKERSEGETGDSRISVNPLTPVNDDFRWLSWNKFNICVE